MAISIGRPPATFRIRADAAAATIDVAIRELHTSGYSTLGIGDCDYVRSAVAVTSVTSPGSFRSVDRFTSAGATDATNGGYWVIRAPHGVTAEMFGALGDGTTDDTAAWALAINWAILKKGKIRMLARVYLMTAALPFITVPIHIEGQGKFNSWFKLTSGAAFLTGLLRPWDCGFTNSDWPREGDTLGIAAEVSGVTFSGFSIIGDKSNAADYEQHGIKCFYRVDNLFVHNVSCHYMRGHGFACGEQEAGDPTPAAYLRESEFYSFYTRECGDLTLGYAAVLFRGQASLVTGGTGYLVNNGAGYSIGATSIVVDSGTGGIVATTDSVTFAGHATRYDVTASTVTGATGTLTISPGLTATVADNVAITTQEATGDSVNQIRLYGTKIVWSGGVGLEIRNDNTDISTRRITFFGVMIHGREEGAPLCNGCEIRGSVQEIQMHGWGGNSAPAGYYNIHVGPYTTPNNGNTASSSPTGIHIQGAVTSSDGGGVHFEAGNRMRLISHFLSCDQNEVRVGADATNVQLDGYGQADNNWAIVNAGPSTTYPSYVATPAF